MTLIFQAPNRPGKLQFVIIIIVEDGYLRLRGTPGVSGRSGSAGHPGHGHVESFCQHESMIKDPEHSPLFRFISQPVVNERICTSLSTSQVQQNLTRSLCPSSNMEVTKLSKNDNSVLAALFDPESSLSNTIYIDVNSSRESKDSRAEQIREQESQALRSINHAKPEIDNINKAISRLTEIIESDPSYVSAWNNRAQARRMLLSDEELPENPAKVADIFQDLGQAICLVTPTTPTQSVSRMDAKVLASAHTHRGYLLLVASKSDRNRKMLEEIPSLKQLSFEELEEAASRELGLGGRYGNETARQLAVKTNPYAKLCGSIVREALTKEISDFYQPQLTLEE